MNKQSENTINSVISHPANPEGYTQILSTPTIFAMDLVGKNLQMNGIDAVWFYPDPIEDGEGKSMLFVKTDQQENARSVLDSLDITDFTSLNGK